MGDPKGSMGKRIHIDFVGPFKGYMWLIVVDVLAKWPEVTSMSTISSEHTVEVYCFIGFFHHPVMTMSAFMHAYHYPLFDSNKSRFVNHCCIYNYYVHSLIERAAVKSNLTTTIVYVLLAISS